MSGRRGTTATRLMRVAPAVVVGGLLALLVAAAASVFAALSHPGPSTKTGALAPAIVSDSSTPIEQSLYAGACGASRVRLVFDSPVQRPSRLLVEIRRTEGARWPDETAFTTTLEIPPEGDHIEVGLPAGRDWARELLVLHLRLVDGGPLRLGARVPPPGWPGILRVGGSWYERQALAFHVTPAAPSPGVGFGCVLGQTGLAGLVTPASVAVVLLVAGFATILVVARPRNTAAAGLAERRQRWVWLLPPLIAGASGLTWQSAVPPFEGPDELAHVQYARFVAVTGSLPRELPTAESPWNDQYHEWVQPPYYYVASALALRTAGLADARPLLEPNVRSRIAGGPERTIYVHRASAIGSQASDALRLLRWLNLVCTMVVVLATARLVQTQVGSARLAIAAGICLALVPQWSAILTMVNNDAAATLAATASFVLLVRLASGNASQQQSMMAGLAIGVALGTKLTTAFLVPAAAAALGSPALRHVRSRRALVLTAGILLASGCILLRNWIVFDDLLASGFRRAVLERSGFLALSKAQPRPGIADPAFWTLLHAQVYEAFWARFGSLGAGPDAGSRIWVIYAAISAVLGVALASGLTSGLGALMPGRFGRLAGTASRAWGEVTAATALASGLIIWVAVNLADRPEVVVHWTPRHLVPLTAPALLLASLGLVHLRRRTGGHPALWRAGAGLLVAALALAWLGSLRHAVQQMHLGYL